MRTSSNLVAGRTLPGVEAECWSDYLCPWCYVGQQRDELMASLGVTVTHLPFELHPEIPPEGRPIRADGRLRATFDRIEEACSAVGMTFRRPTRMPNTRRALETAEWVRTHHSEAFRALHRSLFAAQFATGDPLDDPDLLDALVTTAGAPVGPVRDAVDAGRAEALVSASMARAREVGVASTPTWMVGELMIPGALDPATMERWVTKVVARHRTVGEPRPGPEA